MINAFGIHVERFVCVHRSDISRSGKGHVQIEKYLQICHFVPFEVTGVSNGGLQESGC